MSLRRSARSPARRTSPRRRPDCRRRTGGPGARPGQDGRTMTGPEGDASNGRGPVLQARRTPDKSPVTCACALRAGPDRHDPPRGPAPSYPGGGTAGRSGGLPHRITHAAQSTPTAASLIIRTSTTRIIMGRPCSHQLVTRSRSLRARHHARGILGRTGPGRESVIASHWMRQTHLPPKIRGGAHPVQTPAGDHWRYSFVITRSIPGSAQIARPRTPWTGPPFGRRIHR
jgi:hypothetical protein